ncbi:MAG TPA: Uma2 family endonuclease [Gemmatimonadales bacterium]|jgi:Uma2 family endonuclease|nr:Uma2 family endonuclease [Gemmatimonadales bacterium]
MERTRPVGLMSIEAYLEFEERSPIKHEYVAGEVYAMSGVTTRHNLINLNITRHLHQPARKRGCRVFAADVKLKAAADRIYYPDVIVACGKAAQVELIVEEPMLVVEITSPSTRASDRREKLDAYRRMPSLRMYMIVDQRRRHVFVYRRKARGEWVREEVQGEGEISIPQLRVKLEMDDIYDDVPLLPLAVGEGEEWEDYAEEEVEDRP